MAPSLEFGASQPKDVSPPIRSLTKQTAPAEEKLPVIRSEAVTTDPEKALDTLGS